jgi:hypothetical protein
MTKGKAHGANRQYQLECRDVLTFRAPQLVPWLEDGIDVPFNLPDTCWTVDVALRNPSGGLVVAECRRTVNPVKQDDLAAFAHKVERLRKTLGILVAGVFMAKKSLQIGAIKVGQYNNFDLVILEEGAGPPSFSITFLRYDAEREKRCKDMVMHVPPLSVNLKGTSIKLTHRKTSGESESR